MKDKVALAVRNREGKPVRYRAWLFCHFIALAFWSLLSTEHGIEVLSAWVVYKKGIEDE